jgi:hypothetical protein
MMTTRCLRFLQEHLTVPAKRGRWVPHVAEGKQQVSLMHIAQENTFAVW